MAIRKEIPLYGAEFHMTDDNNSPDNHVVLYQYDEESGQTSFDVVDHAHMVSETPTLQQFEARSMGRAVVGYYNKRAQWGDMVITTNRRKK